MLKSSRRSLFYDIKAESPSPPPLIRKLLSDTELLNNRSVTCDVLLLEVAEKISSVTYHLKKTTSWVMVVLVSLEMFVEVVDSLCENCNLNLGRACVALVCSILLDDWKLFFLLKHVFFHLFYKFLLLSAKHGTGWWRPLEIRYRQTRIKAFVLYWAKGSQHKLVYHKIFNL